MEQPLQSPYPDSNWPGEREPSRHDVEVANELPEPAFLSEFKKCLLSSPEALNNENLMHLDLQVNEPRKYTYPLILLSEFPLDLPPESEIAALKNIYVQCCTNHLFLNRMHLRGPSEPVAVPLSLSFACLASVHIRQNPAQAKNLFLASRGLLGAIMEVDNRESRSPDLLMAATLSSIYGALSADDTIWDKAGQTLCTSMTIARRMRCHDPAQLEALRGRPAPSYSGPLMWCLWLIDIVQALHFDLSISLFTSREMSTSMPSATIDFQVVYRLLLDDRILYNDHIPQQQFSNEDSLLLVMALLSDLLYLRCSLREVAPTPSKMAFPTSSPLAQESSNPFRPFSHQMELDHMETTISLALDKWQRWFRGRTSSEVLALYHYIRMYLLFDQLLQLPKAAGYRGMAPVSLDTSFSVSDQAVREAWKVLDCAAAVSQSLAPDRLYPFWLSVVVFHAGLVVWARQSHANATGPPEYASTRVLLAFKVELDAMPWPCCTEMAATLGRLVSSSQTIHN